MSDSMDHPTIKNDKLVNEAMAESKRRSETRLASIRSVNPDLSAAFTAAESDKRIVCPSCAENLSYAAVARSDRECICGQLLVCVDGSLASGVTHG